MSATHCAHNRTTMAAPLTDDERANIIALIEAGMSRRDIAKQVHRDPATITRIAKSIGHDWLSKADDRTQSSLARAHKARSAYCAERRAEMAGRLQVAAERMLEQLDEPFVAFSFGGRDNLYNEHEFLHPPVDAQFTIVRAVRESMRTVLDIDRHDNRADEGAAAVDEWLRGVIGDSVQAAS